MLTVTVAIPFSWLAVEMKKVMIQQNAVSALRQHGYNLWYDFHFPMGISQRWAGERAKPSLPQWMTAILGEDFFCEVLFVSGGGGSFSETDLISIRQFPHLERLFLSHSAISDFQLKLLSDRTSLEFLLLNYTNVSDEGLQCFNA